MHSLPASQPACQPACLQLASFSGWRGVCVICKCVRKAHLQRSAPVPGIFLCENKARNIPHTPCVTQQTLSNSTPLASQPETGRQVTMQNLKEKKTQSHLATSPRLIRGLARVQLIKHKLDTDLKLGKAARNDPNIRNTRCGSTIVLSITSWATNIN